MPTRAEPTQPTRWALDHNTPPHRLLVERGQPVDVARNALARRIVALRPQPEFVLLCDDDAWWLPGSVEKLLALMHECPRLSALVPMACARAVEAPCMAGRQDEDWNVPIFPSEYGPDELLPVSWAGAHVMLLRGEVLRQVGADPFAPLEHAPVSEDLAFCQRLVRAGHQLALSTAVTVAHVDADHGLAFVPEGWPLRIAGPAEYEVLVGLRPPPPARREYGLAAAAPAAAGATVRASAPARPKPLPRPGPLRGRVERTPRPVGCESRPAERAPGPLPPFASLAAAARVAPGLRSWRSTSS